MALKLYGEKKGAGRAAVEADDTLRSIAYARVLDAIGEGEIEGLVDGLKSIYLNDTPMIGPNGEENFKAVQIDFRNGSQGQTHIEGFPSVENEVAIGVEVKKDTPVVRTVTNQNVDAVRVKLMIPQLSEQNTSNGDLNGSSVSIAIEVSSGSSAGVFTRMVEDNIEGKTMSSYERQYRIELPGTAPWTIRMVRLSEDSKKSSVNNKTFFSSLTEIIDSKLSYPNTALAGLRVDASQFDSIPSRAYHVRLLRVRVPSNYDPIARTYTGAWDGAFKIAWTNNPAWCLYDLITSDRYGLGKHIPPETVDKWALYTIGKYCDELVPDGKGGHEPRFTLNVYLQAREDAFKLLGDLASVFRGMMYWAGGTLVTMQDAPKDPSYVFTNANVIGGEFAYEGTSAKVRHTVVLVSWTDLTDMGRQKVEYVEDPIGIAKYGVIQTEVTAFGCTSQAQAHRFGRWILQSELTETETVTFASGLEGVSAAPGSIIKVRDNYRYGKRLGGRIRSATTTQVTLDSKVTISGNDCILHVVTPDGKAHSSAVRGFGETDTLTLVESMPAPAVRGATWVLSVPGEAKPRDYRIVSVADNGDGTFAIAALAHNPDKYAVVDDVANLGTGSNPGTGPGVQLPPMPKDLKVTVVDYNEGTAHKYKLLVSWSNEGAADIAHWDLEHSSPTSNMVPHSALTTPMFEIDDVAEGYHTIRVRAVSSKRVGSGWASSGQVYVGPDGDFGGGGGADTPARPVFRLVTARGAFLSNVIEWNMATDMVKAVGSVEVWARPGTLDPLDPDLNTPPTMLVKLAPSEKGIWSHIDLKPGDAYTYKLRAIDVRGNPSKFYPEAGVSATASLDVTDILDRMNDSFLNSQFFRDITGRIDEIDLPNIEEIRAILGEGGIQRLEDEIERIRRDQNRSGELLLRSVVVDEEVRVEATDGIARALDAVSIVQEGLALEVNRREILEVQVEETSAAVLNEATVRADGDTALASQINVLDARVETELGAVTAQIVSEQQARASADEAIVGSINVMRAELENGSETVLAMISDEARARATEDEAIAGRISALGVEFATTDAATRALITDEATARANADEAVGQRVSGIQARLNTFDATGKPTGSVEARVASEEGARASGDAANAYSITQVTARLNSAGGPGVTLEQRFSADASTVNGLSAQYTIKINNNGHVSGFGLASTPVNGTPVSTFAVAADRFVIASPQGSIVPFHVVATPYYLNGQYVPAGVYMNDAYMKNGFIRSAHIGDAQVNTLKIGAHAVSVALWSVGSGSASVSFTVPDGEYWEVMNTAAFDGGSTYGNDPNRVLGGSVNYSLTNASSVTVPRAQSGQSGDVNAGIYPTFIETPVTRASVSGHGPGTHTISASCSLAADQDTGRVGRWPGRVTLTCLIRKR